MGKRRVGGRLVKVESKESPKVLIRVREIGLVLR